MVLTVVKYLLRVRLVNRNYITNANIASMAVHIPIQNIGAVSYAVELLGKGHVIAVPTDTVYGLACCATNVHAIQKLYGIKARNENKPVAICVGETSDVHKWAFTEHLPKGLLISLLPGPVTLILNCTNKLHPSLTFHGKVGIRIPDYPFICNIAKKLNCPIALTSANKSGDISCIRIEEFKDLWDKISKVFDDGVLGPDSNRSASTVVDISVPGSYKIIRSGIAGQSTSNILDSYGLSSIQ